MSLLRGSTAVSLAFGLGLCIGLGTTRSAATESANAEDAGGLASLVALLGEVEDDAVRRDVLQGMYQALKGRRRFGVPDGWADVYASLRSSDDEAVAEYALLLALVFGDETAMRELRERVSDADQPPRERAEAIFALVNVGDRNLLPVLFELLDEQRMRGDALRALSAYGDERIPDAILKRYEKLSPDERRDAVATLASRVPWAMRLLEEVERGDVPSRDVSAFTARQLASLENPELTAKLEDVWGQVRATAGDKEAKIETFKRQLTDDLLSDANPSRGRVVFEKTCAGCHRLFEEGRAVGPELTGSQRANLDYVLQNLVDPNAIVGRDFRVTTIVTDAGRVLNGIVAEENDNALVLRTANDDVTVPLEEIDVRKPSNASMMPEGMLDKLTATELRDLVRYLQSPGQVPLPEGGERASQ